MRLPPATSLLGTQKSGLPKDKPAGLQAVVEGEVRMHRLVQMLLSLAHLRAIFSCPTPIVRLLIPLSPMVNTDTSFVSRDVVFSESVFPYAQSIDHASAHPSDGVRNPVFVELDSFPSLDPPTVEQVPILEAPSPIVELPSSDVYN
ncbi:hypothetical protein V2J09_012619 [Rumex salicifolius]